MRSFVLSMILGLGTLGLSLGSPTQVKADSYRGPAFTSGTTPVAYYWRGGSNWRRRAFYPRYGYGYNRGYGLYGGYGGYGLYNGYGAYGGGYRSYYPRAYGGYYPYGGYGRPYSSFYYRPGRFW
jgi:hypothetical protein